MIQQPRVSTYQESTTCQNLAPKFATFALEDDEVSSGLPPAFDTMTTPLKAKIESTQPSPLSVMTRRQANAANTPLYPPLMHANPCQSTSTTLQQSLETGGLKN